MNKQENHIKGRGAQINTHNPYLKNSYHYSEEYGIDEETHFDGPTQFIKVFPKTILNKVDSPDIPFDWSMNPYQGCEHGCIYCYARFSHTYWGYSPGLEFEKKILVKENAPQLLEAKLKSRNWKASTIMLSGNTDCYQPIERDKKITRKILQILWKYKHPVSIITKNDLILRDLDILSEMAKCRLVSVNFSITTLDEKLRRIIEPRTSTAERRLKAIKELSENNIPVNVLLAPVIPAINSYEIPAIIEASARAGANSMGYQLVRLRSELFELFEDWVKRHYPDRAAKVIAQVKEIHQGHTTSSDYQNRMSGQGIIAESIKQIFTINKKRYFTEKERETLTLKLYSPDFGKDQLSIF